MSQRKKSDPQPRHGIGLDGFVDPQSTSVHRLGQQFGLVALAVGIAYLVWRCGWSLHGAGASVAWWLAVPALVVEVTGLLCVALLVWALWRQPGTMPKIHLVNSSKHANEPDYDVAIVATGRSLEDLRATLVALHLDPLRPDALVIDHSRRLEVARLAAEFDANFRVPHASDTTGLATAAAASRRQFILLLDAGDILAAGAARSLAQWMTNDRVAAVQGVVTASHGDSAEHGPDGRHDLTFERIGLNPALGARGTGIVTGSGALIRRSALEGINLTDRPRYRVLWELMPQFATRGTLVIAASGPAVVAEKPLTSAPAVAAERRSRADAGWHLLTGSHGALRARGLHRRDRMALAAWAVRSIDGLRRAGLAGVVLGALLAGRAPFAADPSALLYLWLPAFVLASVSLALLSGGALRPGDRLRGSVRAVGLPVGFVVAISSVLVIRGISDRFTHALHPLDHNVQIGLSAVSLWLLAGSLDSLRLLARRRQNRRAMRLGASGTGRLGELDVYVSDLTMLGAGLLADHAVDVGEHLQLSFSVPSETGITSLQVPCTVRNVRPDLLSAWRIGVEFNDVDSYALNTLAECCAVLPARGVFAGEQPLSGQLDDNPSAKLGPRRIALQVAALLALAGVVSSTAPINAEASAPSIRLVSGVVVDTSDPPVPPSATTTAGAPGSAGPDATTVVGIGTGTDDTSPSGTAPIDTSPTGTSPTDTVPDGSSPAEPATPTDPAATVPTSSTMPSGSGDAGGPGMSGITVIGVCSLDAGDDLTFGTSDDTYGATVSTITDALGHYTLALDGLACWVSIEPPALPLRAAFSTGGPSIGEAMLVDFGHPGAVSMRPVLVDRPMNPVSVSPAAAGSETAVLGDRVWIDQNSDGTQQPNEAGVAGATVTLYGATGTTLGTTSTGTDGRFSFTRLASGMYSLGVSNLPAGLRVPHVDPLTSRTPLVAVRDGEQMSSADVGVVQTAAGALEPIVLPTPNAHQLNVPGGSSPSELPTLLIILMAAFLGGSVLFASTQPIRGRRPISR